MSSERVYSTLVVSSFEKFNSSLMPLLPESDYRVTLVHSINEAQRCLTDSFFDLMIINAPLPDDYGYRLAIDACMMKSTVVMLAVKTELYDEIFSKVKSYGVLALRKPTSSAVMLQALDWMCASRERLRGFEKKNVSLEDKMAEIRIVNRAKWKLIEVLKMTEADAHRYIEKQAMDRCVTKREIAETVLQTYK